MPKIPPALTENWSLAAILQSVLTASVETEFGRVSLIGLPVQHLVEKHLKLDSLNEALETQQAETIVTPKRFMHNINRACEAQPQHIVLPEGMEPRVLRAAAGVVRKGLAKITLLGEPEAIQAEAKRLSLDISSVQLCQAFQFAGGS